MTVTIYKRKKTLMPKRHKPIKEYAFIFQNSHTLLEVILFLYRNKATKNLKSSLYKLQYGYCLILYSKSEKPYFLHLREFCKSDSPFANEYTKEYGKLLINQNAVKTLGSIFFKGL